jgi:hypothetical protein
MFTTDSSVRMFELILMSGRNSRTPICDKKKEEAVGSGTVLEFHRNCENPGKNQEFYRRSRFIWVHRSFVVPNLFGY